MDYDTKRKEAEKILQEYWEKIEMLKQEQETVVQEYVVKLTEKKKEEMFKKESNIKG